MNIIDRYFDLAGLKLDTNIMKYMGFNREQKFDAALRLGDILGEQGIDDIIKEKTKGVVEINEGGYRLRVKFKEWTIERIDEKTRHPMWSVTDIMVDIDPKSTVNFILTNENTYRIGDLFSYDNVDELNALYNTEDNPVTDIEINEVYYEIRDIISDWMIKEIEPLTGIFIEDIHTTNSNKNW